MFKNSYQNGLLSIFYSCGANPLAIWDMEVNNGHIKRLTDNEVNSVVLEIVSTNVATTYITCPPKSNQVLGIKLPFLVMIIKNLKRYFSFEITILDDKNMRRRFRISNFQSTTKIKPFCTTMPIGLASGWNQIQFNLADFTRRAYGTQFLETLRVQVHANARIRRIYFCEKLYTEEELPQDYKLYLPLERKKKAHGKKDEAGDKVSSSKTATQKASKKSVTAVTPATEETAAPAEDAKPEAKEEPEAKAGEGAPAPASEATADEGPKTAESEGEAGEKPVSEVADEASGDAAAKEEAAEAAPTADEEATEKGPDAPEAEEGPPAVTEEME